MKVSLNRVFYILKPLIPRQIQLFLRWRIALYKRKKFEHIWPIDQKAGIPPKGWPGWPKDKKFALVLTHDVDTQRGHDRCSELMDIEKGLEFRSAFNFVPERYNVSKDLRTHLVKNGFEVGVHGLNHDGKLYFSERLFNERASKINKYLKDWGAIGFRSPAMHHNLDWIQKLEIKYDASTFDTDPFEPQSDGVRTIFPFWVQNKRGLDGYLELPYTLCQDFTIFITLREKNIDIWKRKLDWIVEKGGMALLNTHPDYMNFDGRQPGREEYPISYYVDFLEYVLKNYKGQYWHELPKDMVHFWKLKNQIVASLS
jgi:hypothetical protein